MRALFVQSGLIVGVWALWLLALGVSGAWEVLQHHYPISLTMLLGSFVAGSTSVGGGAVAFPMFTKVLHIDGQTALVFSLAIQSIGMTAASLMIVVTRIPVNFRIIAYSSLAGGCGLLFGLLVLGTFVSGPDIKMIFSSFSLLVALALIWDRVRPQSVNDRIGGMTPNIPLLLIASFLGGILSGLIGTGIDFIIFTLMIFAWGYDLKVATATSVVVMAINAMIGFAIILLVTDRFAGEVVSYWLAAVPIVIVGAPVGALACRYLHRNVLFYFLLALIGLDVVSTVVILGIKLPYMAAIVSIIIAAIILERRRMMSESASN
ncbi:MAG: TSUP family transporter [Arenicella sp.]